MTKADLIEAMAVQWGTSKKEAQQKLESTFDALGATIRRYGRFAWPGFGVFGVGTRRARWIVNPQTKERMRLKAAKTVRFRAAKSLKASLPGAK